MTKKHDQPTGTPSTVLKRKLGTCIYVLRQANKDEGREEPEVLMMYRHKEPNLGLWVAPGGKVEINESPRECALRELEEETGLRGKEIIFRGMVTEISPFEKWQWLLFLYVVPEFEGEVRADLREGLLAWYPLSALKSLSMPQSDRIFAPAVLNLQGPFFEATMHFDEKIQLVDVQIFSPS